jgi:hypothetical protein
MPMNATSMDTGASEPVGPGARLDWIREEYERIERDMEKLAHIRSELMVEAQELYAKLGDFVEPAHGPAKY